MKFSKGDILVPKDKQFPDGAVVVDEGVTVASVDFDLNRIRFNAADGARTNLGQHGFVMRKRGAKSK